MVSILIKVGSTTVTTTTFLTTQNILNEYTYDSCINGKGKLCIASSSDGIIKKYSYDTNGNISKIDTLTSNPIWSPTSTSYFTYDLQGNILTSGDGFATTTNSYRKNTLQNISFIDQNSSSTNIFTNPVYNSLGQTLSYDRGALKQINTFDSNNLNRLSNLSLMKYGSNSYSGFATSTLVTLATNLATSTAIVQREKNVPSFSLMQASTSTAQYIYSTNPTVSISVVKSLSYLATATPITTERARSGFEAYYGKITGNGISIGGYTLNQNSVAQTYIDCIKSSTYMRRTDRDQALDLLQFFGTVNPVGVGTVIPTNLTIDTLDTSLVWSTTNNQSVATSSFVGAYFNLFVKDKTIQINDLNAFIQLFKRSSTSYSCDTTKPYSDKITLVSIATGTDLKIPVNQNFISDYFIATSTYQNINVCLSEGHTINKPIVKLSTSNPYVRNELILSGGYDLFTQYKATNTKPIVTNNIFENFGQGLQPKLTIISSDQDNDPIQNAEIYFTKNIGTTTASTTKYNFSTIVNPSTSTKTIVNTFENFPFEYGQSYTFVTRTKDIYGDWSNYSTSTYSSVNKTATNTFYFYCKTKTSTDLGSVNCPDPILNNFNLSVGTVTVATSSNIASSTIDAFQVGKNLNIKLKQNNKYYYSVTDANSNTNVYMFTTGDFKTFQNSSYSYDTLSRIKNILKDEDSKYENIFYSYDELSRLTARSDLAGTTSKVVESYTYSPTGKILNNGGNVYSYNSTLAHAPTQIIGNGNSDILSWDPLGRLASSTSLGNINWSALDRVKQISRGATTSKYYYDTEGNRVLSFVLTGTSTIKSKLFTPNPSIQNTGSTTSYQVLLGNKPIINIDRVATTTRVGTSTIFIATTTTSIQTLITDHLNSIEKVLDFTTGNIMSTSTYKSFGQLDKVGNTNSNRGFTNHQDDQNSTGLIYMNARYQNPSYGIFISPDQATRAINSNSSLLTNPQSLNSYSYTWNNPINLFDLTGLIPSPAEAGEMANQIYKNGHEGDNLSGGWKYESSMTGGTSMKMGVYSRTTDNNTEYSLVSKGTNPLNMLDWFNNFLQPFGLSPDALSAMKQSEQFVKDHTDNEVTFVGHSKGGAEAFNNAVKNNKDAIVINPAPFSVVANGLYYSEKNYSGKVYDYVVKGEILSNIFGVSSKPFVIVTSLPFTNFSPAPTLNNFANNPYSSTPYSTSFVSPISNSINNHGMKTVNNIIDK